MEMRVCFEVSAVNDGERCKFGMQISLGETSKEIEYETIAKAVDVDKLISVACLDTLGVTKEDIKIITPDVYDELYGDDAEEG